MINSEISFDAGNDLERALLEAQAGRLATEKFLKMLLASQVFILLDKEIGPGCWDNSASPMILSNLASGRVLATFTSPERSKGWPDQLPRFKFGLLTDFRWLVKGIAPGVGVVVNPGLPVGLELSPERVSELKAAQ